MGKISHGLRGGAAAIAVAVLVAACGSGSGPDPVAWSQSIPGEGAFASLTVDRVTVPAAITESSAGDGLPIFLTADGAPWAQPGVVGAAVAEAKQAAQAAKAFDVPLDELSGHLDAMTPARLTRDTAVREHRVGDGADGRPAVLEAGTAVLVDRFAMPRMRIASGTPLSPLGDDASALDGVDADWDGYRPEQVDLARAADQPVSGLLIADDTGTIELGGPVDLLCPRFGYSFDDMCEVVAYADLDGSGIARPIAAAQTGSPSIRLITFDDAGEPTHVESGLNSRRTGLGPRFIGAEPATMDTTRPFLLFGAFDVTGDGVPELVMWTHSDGPATFAPDSDVGSANEFMVFQRDAAGHYSAMPAPMMGMLSGDDVWGAPIGWGEHSYRCTGDGIAAIDRMGDDQRVISFGWTGSAWRQTDSTSETYRPAADPALPEVFDCTDHAERVLAVSPADLGVRDDGTTDRTCTVPLPGGTEYTEMTAGRLSCDRVVEIITDYHRRADTEGTGSSRTVDGDDWVCQRATPGSGRLGSCNALDMSWSLERFDRPIN